MSAFALPDNLIKISCVILSRVKVIIVFVESRVPVTASLREYAAVPAEFPSVPLAAALEGEAGADGEAEGASVAGGTEGVFVGSVVGFSVGSAVGFSVCSTVGLAVASVPGYEDGLPDGVSLGAGDIVLPLGVVEGSVVPLASPVITVCNVTSLTELNI